MPATTATLIAEDDIDRNTAVSRLARRLRRGRRGVPTPARPDGEHLI